MVVTCFAECFDPVNEGILLWVWVVEIAPSVKDVGKP